MANVNLLDSADKILATVALNAQGVAVVSDPKFKWVLTDVQFPNAHGRMSTPKDGQEFLDGLAVALNSAQGVHARLQTSTDAVASRLTKARAIFRR